MSDAIALARQSFQKIASDGLARRVADRMHEAVELAPGRGQLIKQTNDMGVVGNVAFVDLVRSELARIFSDALAETFADVAECKFGALGAARTRNAVGNRAVGQHPGDEKALAFEKTHE